MSQPSALPPSPPPRPERSGCLTLLMIGAGILLLLPGVCAVIIFADSPKDALNDRTTLMACLAFFAISAGGIALIWAAVRRAR